MAWQEGHGAAPEKKKGEDNPGKRLAPHAAAKDQSRGRKPLA